MSRIWSANEGGVAEPIGGWGAFGSIGKTGGGFRSLYAEEQRSRAWNVTHPGQPTHAPDMLDPVDLVDKIDPVEQAAQEAFVQGFQEGERVAREALEADNAVRGQLAMALGHLVQTGDGALATMLSQAVIRLVTQIIGEVQIDDAVLQARCDAVANCIEADDARTVLQVNAEDLPLLAMEESGVNLVPAPDLPRGSVRLATSEGWVEDGPDVRLARLKALMDDMEGRL